MIDGVKDVRGRKYQAGRPRYSSSCPGAGLKHSHRHAATRLRTETIFKHGDLDMKVNLIRETDIVISLPNNIVVGRPAGEGLGLDQWVNVQQTCTLLVQKATQLIAA
jgi:hypothetical protein